MWRTVTAGLLAVRQFVLDVVARVRLERDLRDELDAHIAHRTDDLVAGGLPHAEASRRARVEFGAVERYKELCREERGLLPLRRIVGGLTSDIRLAVRRLRAAPLYCVFATLTLGLGIGVTAAAYSALHRAFWRPLGIHQQERVIGLSQLGSRGLRSVSSYDLLDIQAAQQAMESIEGSARFTAALAGNGRAVIIDGESVTGGYFQALDVRVQLGRALAPFDDQPGAEPLAVISEGLWRSTFDADPAIIGKPIRIADRPFLIAGVIDNSFAGITGVPAPHTSVWVTLRWATSVSTVFWNRLADTDRGRTAFLQLFGRLKPGETEQSAAVDLGRIGKLLDQTSPIVWRGERGPVTFQREWTARSLGSALQELPEPVRLVLLLPTLVLLVACTNLANLVLSRGTVRANEIAVRRALGGTRWRLIREQLAEVAIIAGAGAILGLQVARGILSYVDGMITSTFGFLPRFRLDGALEPTIVMAVGGAAILAVLFGGLTPALQLTRNGLRDRIAVDSPGLSAPRWRSRSNLIALQVCVSVCLFLFASFLVRQVVSTGVARSGMDLDRTAMVNLMFSVHHRGTAEVRRTTERILDSLRDIAGVDAAAAGAVWNHGRRPAWARTAGADGGMRDEWVAVRAATGRLFEVLGLPLVSGRTFDASDDHNARAVIINAALARATFGTPDAAGRSFSYRLVNDLGRLGTDRGIRLATVTGVVADTYDARCELTQAIYLPLATRNEPDIEIFARASSLAPDALAIAMRTAVQRIDPELAVSFAGPADVLNGNGGTRMLRMATAIALGLAVFALALSTAGLYGVLTQVVGQRTRELGLRSALGADQAQLRNLILKEGLRPVAEGSMIGIGAAVLMTLSARPLFQKEVPSVTFEGAAAALLPLLIAGAIACYIPARRASRLDPSAALRDR